MQSRALNMPGGLRASPLAGGRPCPAARRTVRPVRAVAEPPTVPFASTAAHLEAWAPDSWKNYKALQQPKYPSVVSAGGRLYIATEPVHAALQCRVWAAQQPLHPPIPQVTRGYRPRPRARAGGQGRGRRGDCGHAAPGVCGRVPQPAGPAGGVRAGRRVPAAGRRLRGGLQPVLRQQHPRPLPRPPPDVGRHDVRRRRAHRQGRPHRRPVCQAAQRGPGEEGRRRAALVPRRHHQRTRVHARRAHPRPLPPRQGLQPVGVHAQPAARLCDGRVRGARPRHQVEPRLHAGRLGVEGAGGAGRALPEAGENVAGGGGSAARRTCAVGPTAGAAAPCQGSSPAWLTPAPRRQQPPEL